MTKKKTMNPAPVEGLVRGPVHIAKKGWGRELWLHNDEKYCSKILELNAGKRTSFHFHKKKHETLYVYRGLIHMRLRHPDGREEKLEMHPGLAIYVAPGLIHQMIALKDTEIIESSTQHFDEDSNRVELGD